MPPTNSRLSATSRSLVIGLLLLAPLLLGADDYLHEIEEEAKRQATTLVSDQPQPMSSSAPLAEDAANRLTVGLDPKAFEQALRENLPGTYTSYQRLDPDRKQRVYDFYRNDNRLDNISAQVARLLSGK